MNLKAKIKAKQFKAKVNKKVCVHLHHTQCGVPLRRHTRQPRDRSPGQRDRSPGQLRIIRGRESKRGAWPWQVSLQLLHPNFGLIGHWCGAVLVHPRWLLTTAHCVHNELFNLPVPALWTAVLGEWDRAEQRGAFVPIERVVLHQRFHHYQHDIASVAVPFCPSIAWTWTNVVASTDSRFIFVASCFSLISYISVSGGVFVPIERVVLHQRFHHYQHDIGTVSISGGAFVPIERVVLHQRFHHYQHDIALMKMTKPADVSPSSRIRTICLPPYEPAPALDQSSAFYMRLQQPETTTRRRPARPPKPDPDSALKYLEKLNNLTKTVFSGFFNKKNKNMRYNVRVNSDSHKQTDRKTEDVKRDSERKHSDIVYDSASLDSVVKLIKNKIAKDKRNSVTERSDKKLAFGEEIDPFIEETNGVDVKEECYATGWGRQQTDGNLTSVLLEAEVPVLPLRACRDRYALTLPLNDGHLCAGSTDGSTGACVLSLFMASSFQFLLNTSRSSRYLLLGLPLCRRPLSATHLVAMLPYLSGCIRQTCAAQSHFS
ncbi:unnamed protein product [Plutella xylostella]|uniref:(diamondback moth) hypothetical protein n=1 Tax=Plutella xylostella TaxID=51655 RepID=A0A8S4EXT9_PLUXY|nr:unnamed protein product [Plutella xylostella]